MGSTLNAVEPLGPPFRSIDEQVFFIPRDGRHEIANHLFKVNVLLDGDCLHAVDDGPPVRFAPGDVLVLPCVCRHVYLATGPRGTRRVHALRILFDPRFLPPLGVGRPHARRRRDAEPDFAGFLRDHLRDTCHIPGEADETLRQLLSELRTEAEQQRPGRCFRVTALCMMLLTHVIRRLERAETPCRRAGERRRRAHLVLQAKEYLVKNLAAELRLDQMAWSLGVSPEHLARTFRRETGQTVFAHLRHLRVEKAKTCLLSSSRSVTSIARLTGFSSVALFSRTFKQEVGSSPLAYRQQRWADAAGPPEDRG